MHKHTGARKHAGMRGHAHVCALTHAQPSNIVTQKIQAMAAKFAFISGNAQTVHLWIIF